MPILELRDIRKAFGKTTALDGLNLSLSGGEVHALIGENGAGKSTLMNIIAGAFRPDSGTIRIKGSPYEPTNPLDARRNRIALIHQELSILPHLSVAENILIGVEKSRLGWMDRRELHRRAESILKIFDHPNIGPNVLAGSLSTAEQQVVEICRALAADAEIILMDEPTSSLQENDVRRLFAVIRKLKEDGIGMIYISHFLEEIREIADSYTVIRDGEDVSTGRIADVADDFLVAQMVGRSVDNLFPQRVRRLERREVVLQINDLSAPPRVLNVELELRRGEILGIAGLVGAGRSELVRAIFGLEEGIAGRVVVNGQAAGKRTASPFARLSQGFGYLSEDRKSEGLALPLSLADNITLTRFSSCSKFGWLDLSKQREQTQIQIKEAGIRTQGPTQPVSALSGGNQQKVAIARLIHQEANILLLDEPTRGVDVGSRAKIYETIGKLADSGKAVLMVSSYLPELFGMCDRLAVMSRGRLSG
ncbi:MAG TPA: sugar ABC transporter ATP-binding protein, partial [Pyrinomonadaceae bacterium]|nr:sugar ABC transporter ATP-binding protein [Pyrinomonadaceae bacterium]